MTELRDTDYIQKPDDRTLQLKFYTVRELREQGYSEGELRIMADAALTPRSPYAKPLEAMRAASATPDSTTFEDTWKANRRTALAAEHTRFDASAAEDRAELLRTAESNRPRPIPDSYAKDLERLRQRDARALAAKENR